MFGVSEVVRAVCIVVAQASIVRVVRRVGLQPSQAFLIANKRSKMPLREAGSVWSSSNGNAASRVDVAQRLQWHVDVGVPPQP